MSFSHPSQVSPTTGSDQSWCKTLYFTFHEMIVSRTTPTLCVLVSATGPSRNPDSSIHVVPVISPFPFRLNQPAYTGSECFAARGRSTVTPVRTGPSPTFNGPSPRTSEVIPTCTPPTSVMAFSGPGVPSKGTPRSRARAPGCSARATHTRSVIPRKNEAHDRITRYSISTKQGKSLVRRRRGAPCCLHSNRQMHQAERCRRHAGDAARLPDRARTNALQLLSHLARKPADRAVFDPRRNRNRLRHLQLLNRFLLLIEIPGKLDFRLHRASLVAHRTALQRVFICAHGARMLSG